MYTYIYDRFAATSRAFAAGRTLAVAGYTYISTCVFMCVYTYIHFHLCTPAAARVSAASIWAFAEGTPRARY